MSLDEQQAKALETLGRDMADVRVTLATLVAEVKAAAHAAELREEANKASNALRDKAVADDLTSIRTDQARDVADIKAMVIKEVTRIDGEIKEHTKSIRQHDKVMWIIAGASMVSGGIAGAIAKLAIGG